MVRSRGQAYADLYAHRKLADGFPDLEKQGAEFFSHSQPVVAEFVDNFLPAVNRLIDLDAFGRKVLVVGTGPKPVTVKRFRERGYDAVAIEPIAAYVEKGRELLGDPDAMRQGACESLPVPDASQGLVLLQAVLEHVDSPNLSLREIHRVLRPGGVAYITTTNRWKFSPRGVNDEFTTPFFNWFPPLLRESYVFFQLHYEPKLANFTPRPAVHWFSYTDLCRIGRREGFAQFYSPLDLVPDDDPRLSATRIRRLLKPILLGARYRPWLRALLLSQLGGAIFMLKRPSG